MDYHLYDNELDVIKNLSFFSQVIFLIHGNPENLWGLQRVVWGWFSLPHLVQNARPGKRLHSELERSTHVDG